MLPLLVVSCNMPLMLLRHLTEFADDSDNSDASASESGNSAPMATAKYVYGGLAAGLMGVAAVL